MEMPVRRPPVTRLRASDKVVEAFDYACSVRDFELAERLLDVLDYMNVRTVRRFGGNRRHDPVDVIGARHRLQEKKREWGGIMSPQSAKAGD